MVSIDMEQGAVGGSSTNPSGAPDRRSEPRPSGEEDLRFIRNFHDVFLSIGLALFGVGLGIFSTLTVSSNAEFDSYETFRASGSGFVVAAFFNAGVMWLLAEFFARGRRLFLPAIVILIGFTTFFAFGVSGLYVLFFSRELADVEMVFDQVRGLPLFAGAATTAAIFAYYVRMKLPFAMGLTGVSLAATAVGAVAFINLDLVASALTLFQFLAGIFLFGLGVFFDARDPERRTRYSDNAFWLHFFAAPLIFSSVLSAVAGQNMVVATSISDGAPAATALLSLFVVLAFAVISLLINRRALLVSGLLTAAIAIAVLIREVGMDGAWTAAVTLLSLGGAMVLLGAGWHVVRRILVAPFPKTGPISRIIPPEGRDGEASVIG